MFNGEQPRSPDESRTGALDRDLDFAASGLLLQDNATAQMTGRRKRVVIGNDENIVWKTQREQPVRGETA